ncbi:MAG TPA: hypothetical protein VFF32_05095 [Dermatophilaceae bacterium]|nr:hypothetical protein [Dermatophilaceae bacterium]
MTAATAMAMPVALLVALPALPAQAATTSDLTVTVSSARTEPRFSTGGVVTGVVKGAPIADFKYILNVDTTGTTDQRSPAVGSGCSALDPGYPSSCLWPSIAENSGGSPIYTQGDQSDFPLLALPDGRYLISVIADGYKIDGAHFCVDTVVPAEPGCANPLAGPLTVTLQPNPLPDGTVRALVFEDNAPTNMGWDVGENLMAGFVGGLADTLGAIQTDVYGNPLCTR